MRRCLWSFTREKWSRNDATRVCKGNQRKRNNSGLLWLVSALHFMTIAVAAHCSLSSHSYLIVKGISVTSGLMRFYATPRHDLT